MKRTNYFRKERILLFLTCWIFTLFLIGCAQKEIKNINSTGNNIICFGDSLTFGYGAQPGEDFPHVLETMISFPVINSGLDGDSSVSALKRLKIDVLDREPLLVIIEFGGNDFLRRVPLVATLSNVEEMIVKIQASGAMVAIADISIGIVMDDYSKGFKKLSEKHKTIYIPDLLKGILGNSSLRSDLIHPNAQGYKILAQRIYRYIIPHLNRNKLTRQSN